MSQFIRRGDPVEAEQWQPGKQIAGVFNEHKACNCSCSCDAPVRAEIAGLNGPEIVNAGDWIINGAFGARYHLPDVVFREGHEEVS